MVIILIAPQLMLWRYFVEIILAIFNMFLFRKGLVFYVKSGMM